MLARLGSRLSLWLVWLARLGSPWAGKRGIPPGQRGSQWEIEGCLRSSPGGQWTGQGKQVPPYQETANERKQQDFDIWKARCLVSRPCPFCCLALGCGAELQVVVVAFGHSRWAGVEAMEPKTAVPDHP